MILRSRDLVDLESCFSIDLFRLFMHMDNMTLAAYVNTLTTRYAEPRVDGDSASLRSHHQSRARELLNAIATPITAIGNKDRPGVLAKG